MHHPNNLSALFLMGQSTDLIDHTHILAFHDPLHPNVVTTVDVMHSPHDIEYFTYIPAIFTQYSHFSAKTSCSSPEYSNEGSHQACSDHPFLAYTTHPTRPYPSSPGVMSVQTSAAHGHYSSRPQPIPVQNVLHVTSDDSTSSSSSLDSDSRQSVDFGMTSPPELARCSRCQRTSGIDLRTGKSNMIKYGLNLWYCTRCAGMVGLTNR